MQSPFQTIGSLDALHSADVLTLTPLSVNIPKQEKIRWMHETLARFRYGALTRDDKGLVRRYLQHMTGYSRAQIARHIADALSRSVAAPKSVAGTWKAHGMLAAVLLLATLLATSSVRSSNASVLRMLTPEKAAQQTATGSMVAARISLVSAIVSDATGTVAYPLVAMNETTATVDGKRMRVTRVSDAATLLRNVAARRASRLAALLGNHAAAGNPVARPVPAPLAVYPAYPASQLHGAAPENTFTAMPGLWTSIGLGTQGQILMIQNGRPVWHDFPYMEQIRTLAPQGDEPTRRAGGQRSGGAPQSSNTTTIINNTTTSTATAPSGWTDGTDVVYLTTGTDSVGIGTDTPVSTLEVVGSISGASLYVASSIEGAGLTSCDAVNQKLLWDSVTKQFTCGTDNAVGTGLSIAIADMRYVQKQGGTMTGALVIDIENGTFSSVGLSVMNTLSGAHIHAEKALTTSGTLVFEGAASGSSLYLGSALRGAGLVDCSSAGTSKLLWNSVSGRFSCGTDTDTDTNTTYTAGQGLGMNGTVITLNATLTGSLIRFNTISGSTIYGKNSVNSSGSITAEGAISGSTLFAGTSLRGAGLVDCSTAGTSKLLWNSVSGRFSCGTDTDTDTNTTYTAGQGLSMNGTVVTLNATITGSLVRFQTVSGSTVYAKNLIASSGSIVLEGSLSGGTINGFGLQACNGASQKLLWNTATGKFECGADVDTNTTYTAGRGLGLNGTSLSLNSTITGSLVRFTTISGSTLYGNNSVNSSGSITAEGAISGSTLFAGTSIRGAGLVDCDTSATSKLLWDATSGRFSCGTDQSGGGAGSMSSGNVLTIGDARYVRTAGGTMTGGLVVQNGNTHTPTGTALINVRGTISGATLYATTSLRSSGSVVLEGNLSGATINGFGLQTCNGASQKLLWNTATGTFECGADVDTDTNTTYTAGKGLGLNGTVITLNATITGSLVRFDTISGSTVYGKDSVNSSGSITAEGAISGSTLFAGTSLRGAGLIDCSTSGTSKLLWNAVSGRFSCGTDQNTGTAYTAGQGLSVNGTVITLNATITGSLVRFDTISGSTVYGNTSVNSSGSITAEGAISGSTLFAGTSIRGGGLLDCDDAVGSKLLWDATSGRFSCGTDQSGSSGLSQAAGDARYVKKAGDTMTGALVVQNGNTHTPTGAALINARGTISGTTIYGNTAINSSGSITAEGAISGSSLYAGTSIRGAGLVDCDTSSTSKLLWDATSGRFSCGTDTDTSSAPFSTGNVLTIGSANYVSKQGDTMTGALTINMQGGTLNTIGLRVLNTFSGAIIHAEKNLTSSGTLIVTGNATFKADAYVGDQIIHQGDTDTYAQFVDDQFEVYAGGVRFLTLVENDSQDVFTGNRNNADLDFDWDGDINDSIFHIDAATEQVRIRGSGAADSTLEVVGTVSGSTIYGNNSVNSSGSITAEGAISGSSLYAGTSIRGAGLVDCDTSSTSKLLWDATSGRFSCGTDTDTSSAPFSTGNVLTIGSANYVSKQGDTMTGALTINMQGGTLNTIGLRVLNTFSGAIIHAEKSLTSSGTIFATGTIATEGTLSGAALTVMSGNSYFMGNVGFGVTNPQSKIHVHNSRIQLTNTSAGMLSTDGSYIEMNGSSLTIANQEGGVGYPIYLYNGDNPTLRAVSNKVGVNIAPKTDFEVRGTISGSLLTISGNGSFSGSVTAEGTISGSSLYAGTSINGAGLSDCDTSSTSKLLWDSTTGRFSCGTDASGSFSTGNVLTIGSAKYVSKQGDTMTGALTINMQGGTLNTIGLHVLNTFSGAIIHAEKSLTSSGTILATGTIATEGTLSGAALTVMNGNSYFLGRLGIGTTSPANTLELNKTGDNMVKFTNALGTGILDGAFVGIVDNGAMYLWNNEDNDILFGTNNARRMTIKNTGNIGIGTASPGSKLAVSGAVLINATGTATMTADTGLGLEVIGAISGSTLFGNNSVNSSGSITAEGTISGANLYVGTSIQGAGLADCDTSSTSKLLWDSTTGRFSCGTDQSGGSFSTGNVLTISDSNYVKIKGDSMTGSLQTPSINLSGVLLTSLNGFDKALDVNDAGLATHGVTRLTSNGNLTNIGSIQSGDISVTMGGIFRPKSDLTTASTPRGVAVGDLNGDGKADIAVTNYAATSVSVFLNNGAGTFAGKVDYTTGSGPHAAVIGDVNGDGKADLVVINASSNTFSVFINTGAGTFAAKADYSIGNSPEGIAMGDLNSDGKLDIAVSNHSAAAVAVFLNNGNGTFADKVTYTVGSGPTEVAIGDLNGDSRGDLAVVNQSSNTVSVLMNTGSGGFAAKVDYSTGTSPTGIAIGDVTGDGKADMAVVNLGSTSVSIFRNTGAGTFAIRVNYTTGSSPRSVAIGDLNGDGKADLAVANNGSTSVSVLMNNGSGIFAPKVDYTTATSPYSVRLGDMNADGKLDMAVVNNGSTSVSVFLNTAKPVFTALVGTGGAVGIGTSTPGAKLAVSGSVLIGQNIGKTGTKTGVTLEVIGTISGSTLYANNALRSSGSITAEGAISGSSLYAGTSINGAGLSDCDTSSTSKLLWDSTTGRFSCGTDQSGGSFSTGNVLTIGNAKYVSKQGDTMTGALVINMQGGNINTIGLKVINTFSGAIVQATQQLRSSGSLSIEGISYLQGQIRASDGTNSAPSYSFDAAPNTGVYRGAAGTLSFAITGTKTADLYSNYFDSLMPIGVPLGTVSAPAFGERLAGTTGIFFPTTSSIAFTLAGTEGVRILANGNVGIGTTTPRGKFVVVGSGAFTAGLSGSTLHAEQSLTSSGSITAEGTISGANLYVGTSIQGAGLSDCDTSSTSKLLWDSTTGRFSCGTDASGSFSTGNVLTIGNAKYVSKQGDTMTGALVIDMQGGTVNTIGLKVINTFSGAIIHAEKSFSASGSATISGDVYANRFLDKQNSNAYFMDLSASTSIQAAGSYIGTDFQSSGGSAGSPGFNFRNAGGDDDTGMYRVGENIIGLTVGATKQVEISSVGLEVLNTVSGSVLYARNAVNSSGSITAEGAISGSTLFAGTSIRGAGLADCSSSGTDKLLWDATTGRFSCGTDQTGGAGFGSGQVVVIGDARYVKRSGDTMTGTLIIRSASGVYAVGLNVAGTMSGIGLNVSGSGAYPLIRTVPQTGTVLMGTGALRSGSGFMVPQLLLSPKAPVLVSTVTTTAAIDSMALQGNTIIATAGTVLRSFDVSNPMAPKALSTANVTSSNPGAIVVQGKYAFIGVQTKIQSFDISNPSAMVPLHVFTPTSAVNALAIQGKYLYSLNTSSARFQVVDIANPANMVAAGVVATGTTPNAIAVQGRYAYITNGGGNTMQIIDLKNPQTPVSIGTTSAGTTPNGIAVQERYAYVINTAGLQIFDISNPTSVVTLGSIATGTQAAITVQGRYAYIVGVNGLQTVDISDPRNPVLVSTVSTALTTLNQISVAGRYAYVSYTGGTRLYVYDLGGLYTQNAEIGSLEVGGLTVLQTMHGFDANFQGSISAGTSLFVAGHASFGTGGQVTIGTGGLVARGPGFSGSSVYAATSFQGAGLSDCDIASSSKLLWDATTGRFSCGTDQAGGGFSTGNVLTIGNAKYVSKQGDTMTGALVINIQGGSLGSIGLRVLNTFSGAIIHAEKELTSSGTLMVKQTGTVRGSGALTVVNTTRNGTGAFMSASGSVLVLNSTSARADKAQHILFGYQGSFDVTLSRTAANILSLTGSLLPGSTNRYDLGSSTMRWRDLYLSGSSLHVGANGNEATVGYNTAGSYFTVGTSSQANAFTILNSNGFIGIGTNNADTKLEVIGTISGSTVYAANALRSSGSITAEGAISGSSLYAGTSIRGAGLGDCDTSATSKLLWDATTGRFSCGTDQAGGGFSTGNVLTIGNAKYVSKQGDTMTGALVINIQGGSLGSIGLRVLNTLSGAIIHAEKELTSSGTLMVKQTGTVRGSGALTVVNTTTNGTGAYMASNGAILALDATNTASRHILFGYRGTFDTTLWRSAANVLSTNGTFSGVTLYATNAVRSSGSITAEGAISGSSLYAGTSISGAGLSDCDTSATSKLMWDSTTGRFSCGTDQTGGGGGFSTGNVLTLGNARYVELKGDSMTGSLQTPSINLSGVLLTSLNGFNQALNLNNAGLATYGVTRLAANGNLTNIGSVQSGEIHATMGGTFASKVDYNVDIGPFAIAIGDVNGDGAADLVSANYNSNSISVLLNTGMGIYASSVEYTTASQPSGVAIADLNGDGRQDVAVSTFGGSVASVFLNTGNGTFAAKVDYTTGTNAESIAIGDLNRDGKPDLVTANSGAASVSVLINKGNGTFAAKADYTTAAGPLGVAIGDLNGDGYSDLVTSNTSATSVSVLLNTGNGTFGTKTDYATGLNPAKIAVGDLNGDGKADVATANNGADTMSVLLNTGNGTLATKVDYATGVDPHGIFMSDLNGDGKADLTVANTGSDTVSIFVNKGNGAFNAKADYATGGDPYGVAAGDLNGDGKADIVLANQVSGTVSVFFNNTSTLLYASAGTGGYVGIGTTRMEGKLNVSSTVGVGTGAYIYGSGTVLALDAFTQSGAKTPHLLFGYRGNFDTRITRTSTGSLTFASNTGVLLTLNTERSDATGNVFQIISDASTSYGGPDENKVFRIQANGAVFTDGAVTSNGADYAEWFYSGNEKLKSGEVVCIDITKNNAVKRCVNEADSNVMGIVSTNPAFIGNGITGADGIIPPGYALIGLIGQVPTKVMVSGTGAIRPGDALTPASTPGYARKALPGESTVGVALEGIESGEGVINVLISRRNSSMTVDAVGQKVLDTIASMKIGDEVQLMVASSLENLNVDAQIQEEVQKQVSGIKSYDADILSLQTELDDLKNQLAQIKSQTGSTTIITQTGSALTADLTAATLVLEQTLATGGDARIGGDLHIDGTLMASSLFVPNGLSIDGGATVTGTLAATTIHSTSGATIDGTLTVNGDIRISSGSLLFDSGATLSLGDLIVERSLLILGDITIDGLARFFGNVEVHGELRVSGRQAGTVTIAAGTTGSTVLFSSGFTAVPVVTASPNDFVLSAWRIKPVTQTGFTIEFAATQDTDVLFSWHALISMGSGSTVLPNAVADDSMIFPMGSDNIPVSSSMYWNACIRNTAIIDADGKPHSCSRYHTDYTWTHPDLLIEFLWNTNITPPLLHLPEGYTVEVTEDADSIRGAFTFGTNEVASSSSSSESSVEVVEVIEGEEGTEGEEVTEVEEVSDGTDVAEEASSSSASSEAATSETSASSATSETSPEELTINPVVTEPEPATEIPAVEPEPEPVLVPADPVVPEEGGNE